MTIDIVLFCLSCVLLSLLLYTVFFFIRYDTLKQWNSWVMIEKKQNETYTEYLMSLSKSSKRYIRHCKKKNHFSVHTKTKLSLYERYLVLKWTMYLSKRRNKKMILFYPIVVLNHFITLFIPGITYLLLTESDGEVISISAGIFHKSHYKGFYTLVSKNNNGLWLAAFHAHIEHCFNVLQDRSHSLSFGLELDKDMKKRLMRAVEDKELHKHYLTKIEMFLGMIYLFSISIGIPLFFVMSLLKLI